jgi:hypothetical protein
MPIDADRFFARINGEGQAPHQQAPPSHVQCEPVSATTDVAPNAKELDADSVLGAKLEAVTMKSLSKADEILDIPLDPERRHYQAELRARASIINTTLNTQARVGEAALHKEVVDRLPEIIKLIQEEEAKLKVIEAKLPPNTADELRQGSMDELRLREVARQIQDRKQDDG